MLKKQKDEQVWKYAWAFLINIRSPQGKHAAIPSGKFKLRATVSEWTYFLLLLRGFTIFAVDTAIVFQHLFSFLLPFLVAIVCGLFTSLSPGTVWRTRSTDVHKLACEQGPMIATWSSPFGDEQRDTVTLPGLTRTIFPGLFPGDSDTAREGACTRALLITRRTKTFKTNQGLYLA